jgi:hypothetical protein
MFFPEQLAEVRVDGEEIVVGAGDDRQLLETAVRDRALDDQRTVQGVNRSLLGVERDLPQQLQVLNPSGNRAAVVGSGGWGPGGENETGARGWGPGGENETGARGWGLAVEAGAL